MRKAKSKAALSVSALAMESTSTATNKKLWPVSATVTPLPVSRPSLDGGRPLDGVSIRRQDSGMRTPESPDHWPPLPSGTSSKRPSVDGASSIGAFSFRSADAQSLRSNIRISAAQPSPTGRGQSPRRQTMQKEQSVPITSWVSYDEVHAQGGAGSFPPSPTDSEYMDAASSPASSRSISQDTIVPDEYFTANNTRVDLTAPEIPQEQAQPRLRHVSPPPNSRAPRPLSPLSQSPPMTPSLTTRRGSSDSDESSLEIIEPPGSVPTAPQELTPAERIVRESKHQWANGGSSPPQSTLKQPRDASPAGQVPSTPKGKNSGLLRRPSFMKLKSPQSDQKSIKSTPSPSLFNIRIPTRDKAPTVTPYLSPAATPTSPNESVTSSSAASVRSSPKPESFLLRRFAKGKQKQQQPQQQPQRPMSLDPEAMDSWELVETKRASKVELDKEFSIYGHPNFPNPGMTVAGTPEPVKTSLGRKSSIASMLSVATSRRTPAVSVAPASPSMSTVSSRRLTSPSTTTFTMEPVGGAQYVPPSIPREEKKKRPPPPVPPRRRTRPSEKSSHLSISLPASQAGSSTAPPGAQRPQAPTGYVEERMSAPPPRYVSYAEPLTPASATSASSTELHSVSPSTPTFGRMPFASSAAAHAHIPAGVARSYSQSTMASAGTSGASIRSKESEKDIPRELVSPQVIPSNLPGTYMYAGQPPLWGSLPPHAAPPSDAKYPQYWGTSPPGAPPFVPPPLHYHYPVYATMPPGCYTMPPPPPPHWHAPPEMYHHHHHHHPHQHVPPSPYGLQTCSSLAPCSVPSTPMMAGYATMPPGTPMMQSCAMPPVPSMPPPPPPQAPVQAAPTSPAGLGTPYAPVASLPAPAPVPAQAASRPQAAASIRSIPTAQSSARVTPPSPATPSSAGEPARPVSPSGASIRSERYGGRPLPTLPPGTSSSSAPSSPRLAAATAQTLLSLDHIPQAPIVVNAMYGSSLSSNPHNVRSVVASPTSSYPPEWLIGAQNGEPETDLDVLISNLDVGAKDGTNYEALTLISEIIGPATPPLPDRSGSTPPGPSSSGRPAGTPRTHSAPVRPAGAPRMHTSASTASTVSSSSSVTARSEVSVRTNASASGTQLARTLAQDGMPVVGKIEVERKRVTKDGRTKLKLALLGVRVDKCGICLSQFKEDESAALGPTCQHGFHDQCLRSWLCRSRTCPLCRVSFGPAGRVPHAVRAGP